MVAKDAMVATMLSVLCSLPALRSIATSAIAERLAAEVRSCGRSEVAACRGLRELAEHAGDAAAAGAPWSAAALAARARSYVRHARELSPVVERPRSPVERPRSPAEPRMVPPAPTVALEGLAGVLGAVRQAQSQRFGCG